MKAQQVQRFQQKKNMSELSKVNFKMTTKKQGMVAHNYNPNYSGGRDWEDCGS
jgi:hypothetical protein